MTFPKAIMDFLIAVEKNLSKEIKKSIKTSKYNELENFHFGLGTYIRNEFLTKESAIYEYFIEMGIGDKDRMSYLLVCCLYFYLKNK